MKPCDLSNYAKKTNFQFVAEKAQTCKAPMNSIKNTINVLPMPNARKANCHQATDKTNMTEACKNNT